MNITSFFVFSIFTTVMLDTAIDSVIHKYVLGIEAEETFVP